MVYQLYMDASYLVTRPNVNDLLLETRVLLPKSVDCAAKAAEHAWPLLLWPSLHHDQVYCQDSHLLFMNEHQTSTAKSRFNQERIRPPCTCPLPSLGPVNHFCPSHHITSLSRKTKLGHLAHLALLLRADLVRGAPPQLDRLDLLLAVPGMPHAHLLLDAAALLGGEVPARLRLELEFVALRWKTS